jgi:hypothetical protein
MQTALLALVILSISVICGAQDIDTWFCAIGFDFNVSPDQDPCRARVSDLLGVKNMTSKAFIFTRSLSNSVSYSNNLLLNGLQFHNLNRALTSITSSPTPTGMNVVLNAQADLTPPYDLDFAVVYRLFNFLGETPKTNIMRWIIGQANGPVIPIIGMSVNFPEAWIAQFPNGLKDVTISCVKDPIPCFVENISNASVTIASIQVSMLNVTVEFPKIITGCKPLVVPPAEQNDSPFRPRSSASKINLKWLWMALLILLAVQ